ncbi:MAG: AAA family ATPase [Fluviicola sp. XM-24bin1]|nr:MAG: AAA family ATPase [Fluviicola sp. XM-24bin1]
MTERHPHQQNLLECIALEMQEQEARFQLEDGMGLKKLKSKGLALHPIKVTRKYFGYAEYPELEFHLPFASETEAFKPNAAVEFLIEGEEAVKGIYLGGAGRKGAVRLYAPEFPDWVEDNDTVIKLAPDHHTEGIMKEAVKVIAEIPEMKSLFHQIHGDGYFGNKVAIENPISIEHLNESQRVAVTAMEQNEHLMLVHGPPGTGKTTTLVAGIQRLIESEKSVLVTAPSNAAVDHIAKELLKAGVKILRVGNTLKVDEVIYPHTSEGGMQGSKEQKQIKKLKIQAEELRKMALQYKRNFGREERAQRSLLLKEVKHIRKEIKDIRAYFDEKLMASAQVILGTPVGLKNTLEEDAQFDVLVMDEAGQSLEPLAWAVFPMAKSWVLAGDPFQLPPTVLSRKAINKAFNKSILEQCFRNAQNVFLLDTQYRMRASISQYSNEYFYNGELKTPEHLKDSNLHVAYYDTAGTGFEEKAGEDGNSRMNEGELDMIVKLMEAEGISPTKSAFISPYSGQVALAKDRLDEKMRVSTIDSFQGQECETVIISLVRSNAEAEIGFLKDYRRMNVAITRAKENLIIIGDSATIGQDAFYAKFLEYVEGINGYKSAWELM